MSVTVKKPAGQCPKSWRAAVRRLFALASSGQAPSAEITFNNLGTGGMFNQAHNTRIRYANFTIHQYGGVVPDEAPAEEQQDTENTITSLPPQETNTPPSAQRESPDVYVDCLITKNRGFPLWIPSPNMSLPMINQKLGVSLGDVGVLTPEGGFDFLFNIFLDASHPVNAAVGVPAGFVPFRQTKGSADVEFVEWNAGSYIASPNMSRVDDGSDRLKTTLQSRAPEAAVLMIPEEIRTARVHVTVTLRTYVEKNIVAWYEFVKQTLGRDLANGELRVVYSCRKSAGFGIATAFNADRQENTHLTFSVDSTWSDISGCPYRWSHTGSAEVKAGSSQQEYSDFLSANPVRNQCLFISTIDTKVSPKIWKEIELSGVMTTGDAGVRPTSDTLQPLEDHLAQQPTENSRTQETTSPNSSQYHKPVFHPSAILHHILETLAPGLPVYMVLDDDWAPFIKECVSGNKDIDVRDFVCDVLEKKMIVEHSGKAFFSDAAYKQAQDEIVEAVGLIQFRRIFPSHVNKGDHDEVHQYMATHTLLTEDPAQYDQTQGGLGSSLELTHHGLGPAQDFKYNHSQPLVPNSSEGDVHESSLKRPWEFIDQQTLDKLRDQVIAKITPVLDDSVTNVLREAFNDIRAPDPKLIRNPYPSPVPNPKPQPTPNRDPKPIPESVSLIAPDIGAAQWIWTDEQPYSQPPKGTRTFRKTVALPAGQAVDTMLIDITCDGCYSLYVNGCVVGNATTWDTVKRYSINISSSSRSILIEIYASSDPFLSKKAGLIASAVAWNSTKFKGRTFNISTDASWKVSLLGESSWKPARVEVPYGGEPWGCVIKPTKTSPLNGGFSGFVIASHPSAPLASPGPFDPMICSMEGRALPVW